ncbi:MAG: hypothetical protein M3198_16245 [Actinomycetota bacterium]|nr:hypothetical protein [Actinomycetota bacterium]
MKSKVMSVLVASGLVAGLGLLPAKAATVVPENVQITDPAGDANYLNDQGLAGVGLSAGGQGVYVPDSDDNVTPADVGNASDVLKVWFSNTADKVSAHILTERAAPATAGLVFRVMASPGEGEVGKSATGCLWFEAYIAGEEPNSKQKTTYQGSSFARLRDVCNLGSAASTTVPGEFTIETIEEVGAVTTITIPRSASPLLGKGETLTKPYIEVRNLFGGEAPSPVGTTTVTAPVVDTSKVGLDYKLVEEQDKKGCKKKKNKKKKCKKVVESE